MRVPPYVVPFQVPALPPANVVSGPVGKVTAALEMPAFPRCHPEALATRALPGAARCLTDVRNDAGKFK